MSLRPTHHPQIPYVKPLHQVGMLFDIPTCTFLDGRFGETLTNGGISYITGIAGVGNCFKTTILKAMMLAMAGRYGVDYNHEYDTEINTHPTRTMRLHKHISTLQDRNLLDEGSWIITDKTIYDGEKWFDAIKEEMGAKRKNAKVADWVKSPFLDRDYKSSMQYLPPWQYLIDSLSEFITSDVLKMQDENMLGESGANTMSMRQGLAKSRMMQELPSVAAQSNSYFYISGHLGSEFNLDPRSPPVKKLAYLKQGVKLKGIPEKFTFLSNNFWLSYGSTVLVQNDKTAEFPRSSDDDRVGNTDLSAVTLTQLRGKTGPSGMTIQLVVSQDEGVIPGMSEFYYLKNRDRYGFTGNNTNYQLVLYPDCALQRTRVRGKIEKDVKLQRALNILAELCQIDEYKFENQDRRWLLAPQELYDRISALGYKWNYILEHTRGWWTFDHLHTELKFLSIMDLLKMAHGHYIPYWCENPPAAALAKYREVHGKDWVQPTGLPAGHSTKVDWDSYA